jgi:hypothetical protein
MPTKLGRKQFPGGYSPTDFTYKGRPAKDQGDFGSDVGVADCVCVNQFGEANNSKMYHGGVVQSGDGKWWVYLEWGRVKPGKSWNGAFAGQDFQFVECSSEGEARAFFAKQLASKNVKRLEEKVIGGVTVWAGKKNKDGYLVQSLATREKGLPDAYSIKDDSGIAKTKAKAKAAKTKAAKAAKGKPAKTFQPQVVKLAQDLVGGVQTYTRALVQSSGGVTPTMGAITKVRDQFIPAAMGRIKAVGNDMQEQINDRDLQAISKAVYALVPRYIPRTGLSDEEAILSGANILALQADLDAFESSLTNEDFSTATPATTVDPDSLLNAQVRWIDPNSDEGRWLAKTFQGMSNNRHGYMGRGGARILNMFAVARPDRDARFAASVAKVAAQRKGQFGLRANLQAKRTDLGNNSDAYAQANVILAVHGTRSVNIAPIMGGNFRLPRSLPGAQITGANFGHGVYFATDWRKAYGYTGHGRSYWASGGQIQGRGFFMFMCDYLMGLAYRAPSTGSWGTPPKACVKCSKPASGSSRRGYGYSARNYCQCGGQQVPADSVFGVGGDSGHALQNDEHIIFDPSYQRIRYVIEGNL